MMNQKPNKTLIPEKILLEVALLEAEVPAETRAAMEKMNLKTHEKRKILARIVQALQKNQARQEVEVLQILKVKIVKKKALLGIRIPELSSKGFLVA